jgi:hypothetical protein
MILSYVIVRIFVNGVSVHANLPPAVGNLVVNRISIDLSISMITGTYIEAISASELYTNIIPMTPAIIAQNTIAVPPSCKA